MTTRTHDLEALSSLTCAALDIEARAIRSLWLFGSRTTGDSGPDADWDVLVVGDETIQGMRRVQAGALDLVVVSSAPDAPWLGSDLAVHVARHGRLFVGEDDWRNRVDVQAAMRLKRRRTDRRLRHLGRAWFQLSPRHRLKHGLALRRDLQRLQTLEFELDVPTGPSLDARWASMSLTARRALLAIDASKSVERRFLDDLAAL